MESYKDFEIKSKAYSYVMLLFLIIGMCVVSTFIPLTFLEGASVLMGYHVLFWGYVSMKKKSMT